MKTTLISICFFTWTTLTFSQSTFHPCSDESITERHLIHNSNFLIEKAEQLKFMQRYVEQLQEDRKNNISNRSVETYQIPIVLHIFHWGDDGKMKLPQIMSGLEILNDDFNGRNDDFDEVDADFLDVRGKIDIEFCLATIDPNGNETDGILYHEDQDALINEGDLFRYGWDNYKYLNIYIPKYVFGKPSDFTAYAYYPNSQGSDMGVGGIFYSSIRWGYGDHSELEEGAEWASIITHEAGHWLNVRHTFENGCNAPGDMIDDTPYTTGSGVELTGCYNNDFSCDEQTNGSNYMDYNADCKRMFTQGQADWMIAALNLPSRFPLWQEENLMATGCAPSVTSTIDAVYNEIKVYPVPASNAIQMEFDNDYTTLQIYGSKGELILSKEITQNNITVNIQDYPVGIYFYQLIKDEKRISGKFIVD